jgi:RecJ-like exonuclease
MGRLGLPRVLRAEARRRIEVTIEPCPDCDGTGRDVDYTDCETCHGLGILRDEVGFGRENVEDDWDELPDLAEVDDETA